MTTDQQTLEAIESNLARLGVPESEILAMHLGDIVEELPRLTEALGRLSRMNYDAESGILGSIDASLSHLLNHIPQAAQLIDAWIEGDEVSEET